MEDHVFYKKYKQHILYCWFVWKLYIDVLNVSMTSSVISCIYEHLQKCLFIFGKGKKINPGGIQTRKENEHDIQYVKSII